MLKSGSARVEGLLILMETGVIRGLRYWGDNLIRRGIPAVFTISEDTVDEDPGMVKDLSDKGIEIGGLIIRESLNDETYDHQYEWMSRISDKIRSCTNKPMRVLNAKHFLHNEATIKVAHELGVNYVLMRGAGGTKAVVYKPIEYNTAMVAVSMIPALVKEKGMSSLCEQWSAGGTPEYLRNNLFGLTTDKVTVALHTHVGGVKLRWWNVLQDFLNANIVSWVSIDEFAANPIALPYAQIPSNVEIRYGTPKPNIPMEQEPEYQPE